MRKEGEAGRYAMAVLVAVAVSTLGSTVAAPQAEAYTASQCPFSTYEVDYPRLDGGDVELGDFPISGGNLQAHGIICWKTGRQQVSLKSRLVWTSVNSGGVGHAEVTLHYTDGRVAHQIVRTVSGAANTTQHENTDVEMNVATNGQFQNVRIRLFRERTGNFTLQTAQDELLAASWFKYGGN